MTEIDKLINQAFPDELGRVEPVRVDEEKILAMTLDKLGISGAGKERPARAAAAGKSQGPRHQKPPVKRRTVRREESGGLVEVRGEPSGSRAGLWIGWAVAACIMVACAAVWGPWIVENLVVEPPARQGVFAAGGGQESAPAPETAKSAEGGLTEEMEEDLGVNGNSDREIYLKEVSALNEYQQFTVEFEFPGKTKEEVTNYNIYVGWAGTARANMVSRENEDGRAKCVFYLNSDYELDGRNWVSLPISVHNIPVTQAFPEFDAPSFPQVGYEVYLNLGTEKEKSYFMEFSEATYNEYNTYFAEDGRKVYMNPETGVAVDENGEAFDGEILYGQDMVPVIGASGDSAGGAAAGEEPVDGAE